MDIDENGIRARHEYRPYDSTGQASNECETTVDVRSQCNASSKVRDMASDVNEDKRICKKETDSSDSKAKTTYVKRKHNVRKTEAERHDKHAGVFAELQRKLTGATPRDSGIETNVDVEAEEHRGMFEVDEKAEAAKQSQHAGVLAELQRKLNVEPRSNNEPRGGNSVIMTGWEARQRRLQNRKRQDAPPNNSSQSADHDDNSIVGLPNEVETTALSPVKDDVPMKIPQQVSRQPDVQVKRDVSTMAISSDSKPAPNAQASRDSKPLPDAQKSRDSKPVPDVQASRDSKPAPNAQASHDSKAVPNAQASRDAKPLPDAQTSRDSKAVPNAQTSCDSKAVPNAQASRDSKPAPNAQESRDSKPAPNAQASRDSKAVPNAQASRDSKAVPNAQASRDSKPAPNAQASRDSKPPPNAQASRDSKPAPNAQASRDSKAVPKAQASRDSKPLPDAQTSRDSKDVPNAQASRDSKPVPNAQASCDSKPATNAPASRDSKPARNAQASRDSKAVTNAQASRDSKPVANALASRDPKPATHAQASRDSKPAPNAQAARDSEDVTNAQASRESKPAPDAPAACDPQPRPDAQKPRDSKPVANAPASRDSEAAPTAQASRDSKPVANAPASRDSKPTPNPQASRDSNPAPKAQVSRDSKPAPNAQVSRDSKPAPNAQVSRDSKPAPDAQASRDSEVVPNAQVSRDSKPAPDAQASRDPEVVPNAQASRDSESVSDAQASRDSEACASDASSDRGAGASRNVLPGAEPTTKRNTASAQRAASATHYGDAKDSQRRDEVAAPAVQHDGEAVAQQQDVAAPLRGAAQDTAPVPPQQDMEVHTQERTSAGGAKTASRRPGAASGKHDARKSPQQAAIAQWNTTEQDDARKSSQSRRNAAPEKHDLTEIRAEMKSTNMDALGPEGRECDSDTSRLRSCKRIPADSETETMTGNPMRATGSVSSLEKELSGVKAWLAHIEAKQNGILVTTQDASCQTDLYLLDTLIEQRMIENNAISAQVHRAERPKRRTHHSPSVAQRESKELSHVEHVATQALKITDPAEYAGEVKLFHTYARVMDTWLESTTLFSMPVRHLGPKGGKDQANLFGAKARQDMLLRSSDTMDQWKSWAVAYMSSFRANESDYHESVSSGARRSTYDADLAHPTVTLKSLIGREEEEVGWVTVWSSEYQRCYYWNRATDAVTWVQPIEA